LISEPYSPAHGQPPLILAVDDQPENLWILEADLQEAGYRVQLAESGRIALEKIAAGPPDLLLLDISMPGMDGLTICRMLRQDRATRELPVIMVTGRDNTEDVVAGLDAGANDYITKPIEVEILMARIRTQLRLKELQDELHRTIGELEQLQQLRADFVAMVTHDLKTPLTSIMGGSSMLLEEALGACPSPEFRSELARIYENGHKLTRLINDFLTFSRIEAGKLEILLEPVDLNLAILQAMMTLKRQAEIRRIAVNYESREGLPLVRGDASQIDRAICNVLSNAIKFSPEGERVQVRLKEKEDRLSVEIEDRGPGISREMLPRLFERYFRARAPRTVEGTGLGLSIVKAVMEAHGGTVEVRTAPGEGSCFTLSFPVKTD
jgi:signal transduction histidine kinase